jgi:hypothetical protein
VDAVIDGVGVRQRVFERGERLALAFGRAGGGKAFPVVGNQAGHEVGRRRPVVNGIRPLY